MSGLYGTGARAKLYNRKVTFDRVREGITLRASERPILGKLKHRYGEDRNQALARAQKTQWGAKVTQAPNLIGGAWWVFYA